MPCDHRSPHGHHVTLQLDVCCRRVQIHIHIKLTNIYCTCLCRAHGFGFSRGSLVTLLPVACLCCWDSYSSAHLDLLQCIMIVVT